MASRIIPQSQNLNAANDPALDVDQFATNLANLTKPQLDGLFRFLVKFHNGDPKTLRLAGMFDRGELSGQQLLSMY